MTDSAHYRAMEYEQFKDKSMAELLEELGIHTTTYRELRQAYRKGTLHQ